MIKVKDNVFFLLSYLLTIIYVIWSITPYFQRNVSSSLVLCIVVFWVVTFILNRPINSLHINKIYIYILVWIVILILQYLRAYHITSFGNFLSGILFFFPAFLLLNLKNNANSNKYMQNISRIIIFAVLINIVSNVIMLFNDITLSKNMTGSVDVVVDTYYSSNLATLPYMAFVALLLPIFLFYFKKEKKVKKLFFLLIIILSCIFIYLAGSFITILAVLFGVFLLFFLNIKQGYMKLFTIITFLIFFLVLLIFKDPIAIWLYQTSYNINNIFYCMRVQELALNMLGVGTEGSFRLRMYDIGLSMQSFLTNPILGKGLIYSDNLHMTGIGMHSQIVDDLARFGLTGGLILGNIYYKWFKSYCLVKGNRNVNAVLFSLIGSIIFFALFNMFSNQVYGLLIFFCIPIFVEINQKN
jgi:hypothetical protein